MKILVVGQSTHLEDCRQKLGDHEYISVASHNEVENKLRDADLIFDFLAGDFPRSFAMYASHDVVAFLNTWKVSLATMRQLSTNIRCTAFGFNGFPTMFNRQFLEVCVSRAEDIPLLKKICEQLKVEYLMVDDRVGMVTPRVLCMIINEAYYTVQEGTATREDIDQAMKLGTNYPFGPFEWCDKLGIKNVYDLLISVYEDTKDERYKISPLLKKEALRFSTPGETRSTP